MREVRQRIIHAPRRPYPMDLVLANGDRTRLKLQDKLHVCMFCEDRVEPPACDVLDQSSPICVVTAYTRDSAMWNAIGSFAAARTKAYCVANGYDYRCHTQTLTMESIHRGIDYDLSVTHSRRTTPCSG